MGDVLQEKSYQFALRIVRLSRYLTTEQREFVLSKQVLRSGTSIGANVEESKQAQSKVDFIHKMSIANKLISDCEELQKILVASIKTSKG